MGITRILRPDFKPGDLLRFHLTDGTSAEGEYQRRTRRYYHVASGKIEANAKLVEVSGDRLLVRRHLVKLVQAVDA